VCEEETSKEDGEIEAKKICNKLGKETEKSTTN
jgi:hypothetical protein